MKLVTIVGARPQFIKAWPMSQALRAAGHQEYVIHTGQHYDFQMSGIFYQELDIPQPSINLEVGSGPHGRQTGLMLERIETVLIEQKPDWVVVYGDTNSTLAGALAAAKLHIRVAHVEAGLRSFNRRMPEETNRVLTDHCSDLLFCPTDTAVTNLKNEGVTRGVHQVGDVMYDALVKARKIARERSTILQTLGLKHKGFLLATVHRAENTDDPERLRAIMTALTQLAEHEPVIFPLHPRTRKALAEIGFDPTLSSVFRPPTSVGNPSPDAPTHRRTDAPTHRPPPTVHRPLSTESGLRFISPLGYLDMLRLEESARLILTDSGGMQKEAFWLKTPCVTLRSETEWVETVKSGWNRLAGTDAKAIVKAAHFRTPSQPRGCDPNELAAPHLVGLLF